MRPLTLAILLLSGAVCHAADGSVKDFFPGKRASFDFETSGSVSVSGSAVIQGNCFRIETEGLCYYCNGSDLWTVDRKSREIYIENWDGKGIVDKVSSFRMSNGALSAVWKDGEHIANVSSDRVTQTKASDDLSPFVYVAPSADSGWIVTDLR